MEPSDGLCYTGAYLVNVTDKSYDGLKAFLTDVKAKTNKGLYLMGFYTRYGTAFPIEMLRDFDRLYQEGLLGGIYMAWHPENPKGSTATINEIVNGEFDAYIRDCVSKFKELSAPLFVKWGAEPNGDWHGYGYDPNLYQQGWRRTHEIFEEEGLSAQWVFHVNQQPRGSYPQFYSNRSPWKDYYPGDEYVDWISVSWHAALIYGRYRDGQTIDFIFDEGEYLSFAEEHNKPFMFGECGNDKYHSELYNVPLQWQVYHVVQQFDFMKRYDRVKAFVWYDLPYTFSMPDVFQAYYNGVSDAKFIDIVEPSVEPPPPPPPPPLPEPPPSPPPEEAKPNWTPLIILALLAIASKGGK